MKMKAFLPVAGLALLFGSPSPRAQSTAPQATAPGRLADAIVPGPAETVTIDQPANLFAAFAVFARVLDAAGVRYGLEGPAWDPAAPPIDLARLVSNPVPLGGRRLGEALDLIMKAAPQYRWAERDGLIVVRSTADGAGILDRRVPQFALTDASPRGSLEQVMAAIDPARPRNVGLVGFGRQASGAGFKPERIGRNVTISMKDATLQAILGAIARENGALSWTIKYDRAPAAAENATVTFIELGVEVTALSPYSQQTPGATPVPLSLNRLSISPSLSTMLTSYADRAGLRVSVEEVAARLGEPTFSPPQMSNIPPLELPDAPAAALARIVALDSRYEMSETAGRYHVRPKAGVPGRLALLDQPVDSFRATNEPASAVIERAGQILGTVRTSPALAAAQRAGAPPSASATAMAQPIDVTVAAPATVRDVFNAIADATGWNWTLRPAFAPGRPTNLSLQWRSYPQNLTPRGSSGPAPAFLQPPFSTSVTITLPADLSPPISPTRTPAVTMPAALDRPIAQMSLDMLPGLSPFRQIGARASVPMGIEDIPRARRDDPRYTARPQPSLVVGPAPFSDALYVLLERLTDYEILPAEGIVNVAPSSLAGSATYLMNRPLEAFSVKGIGVFRAVGELRRRLDPQFVPADWVGAGQGTLNTPVTLSLTRATPRAILNEIARQHGRLTWTSAFDGAEATVANWVVTLVPIDNAGPPIALSARGGALAAPPASLATSNPLAIAPGARAVMLDLPVTAMSVRGLVQQASRATGVSIGFAGVLPASTSRPAPTEYYNLTGLTIDEMLAKLVELAPEYVTSVDKGVYHIRPRELPPELTRWLDQRVAKFDQRYENLRDAMQAVATIGAFSGPTPGARSGGGGAGSLLPPGAAGPPGAPPGRGGVAGAIPVPPPGVIATTPTSPAMEAMIARTQKTIVLSMTDVTVREILDEIARQFGSLQWMVEQRANSAGGVAGLSLMLSSEGWSMGTSVR
jgi:hypothetical protein